MTIENDDVQEDMLQMPSDIPDDIRSVLCSEHIFSAP